MTAAKVRFISIPSQAIIDKYTELHNRQTEEKKKLHHIAGHESVTPDGKVLELAANISSIKELEIALSSGARGVGLFRTEFLYMDRNRFPREEEQFDVYRSVVEKLKGNSLVIRTLDIGEISIWIILSSLKKIIRFLDIGLFASYLTAKIYLKFS